ncbi:type II secretion system F family protein [Nocardia sp. NPDC051030]|uniref:type II secretion system F family protein n=1 Tax=Nocardia sp. NPDC051030 TaxID=3155162 RepID=UPI003445C7CC
MSLLAKAILFAILGGAGLTLIVAYLLPGQPALRDALDRLNGKADAPTDLFDEDAAAANGLIQQLTQRAGRAAYPWLTRVPWLLRVPTQDLAILRRSPVSWLGDKILSATVGLIAPSMVNMALALSGVTMAWQIPMALGLVLAVVLWFAPDLEVHERADAARQTFRRALGAYVELAAYARNAGIGVTQSLEAAANVAPTWVFRRIADALGEAAYAGRTSWSALETVGKELGVVQLVDVAHTMELSGTHGSSVYDTLRSLAASMRNEMLTTDQGGARDATQKIAIPLGAMVIVFIVMLVLPGLQAAF